MDVVYPFTLFCIIGVAALFACTRVLPPSEGRWLSRLLFAAYAVRLVVATVFATFPATRIFHEDANGYELLGLAMARGWAGSGPPVQYALEGAQNYGYPYVVATIYYGCGEFRALPSYLNCLVGTISIYFVYRLARQFFHPLVARHAALLAAFIPSMILWSSTTLKDSIMVLLILIGLLSSVSLKRRFSLGAVAGVAFSLLAMQPIRFYMTYFLGFAIFASLFLEPGVRLVSGVYKQLFVAGTFVALLILAGLSAHVEQGAQAMSFERLSTFRHGMAVTANSGFNSDVDVSTPMNAIMFLPVGAAELLLGPFPWQFNSLRAALAAPETIYWWLLLPGVVRGMWWMTRKRFAETSPLLLFAVTLTCAYSLMHGNVGSGLRQRAQIFTILFIFASLGSYQRRCLRAGLSPDLLLEKREAA
jgi:hypothetical protein